MRTAEYPGQDFIKRLSGSNFILRLVFKKKCWMLLQAITARAVPSHANLCSFFSVNYRDCWSLLTQNTSQPIQITSKRTAFLKGLNSITINSIENLAKNMLPSEESSKANILGHKRTTRNILTKQRSFFSIQLQ